MDNNILNDIAQINQQNTQQTINATFIQKYLTKSLTWLRQAAVCVHSLQAEKKLDERASKNLQDFRSYIATKITKRSENSIKRKQIVRDGYALVNEIAESIRGQSITYRIFAERQGNFYVTDIPLSTLLSDNWTTMSHIFTLSLKNFTKAMMSEMTLTDNIKELEKFKSYFEDLKAHEVDKEVFDKYPPSANMVTGFSSDGNRYEAVLQKIKNPNLTWMEARNLAQRGLHFAKGGDIDEFQVKGEEADITNISTLINAVTNLTKILGQARVSESIIKNTFKQNGFENFINQAIEGKSEQEIKQLLQKMFTSQ